MSKPLSFRMDADLTRRFEQFCAEKGEGRGACARRLLIRGLAYEDDVSLDKADVEAAYISAKMSFFNYLLAAAAGRGQGICELAIERARADAGI